MRKFQPVNCGSPDLTNQLRQSNHPAKPGHSQSEDNPTKSLIVKKNIIFILNNEMIIIFK